MKKKYGALIPMSDMFNFDDYLRKRKASENNGSKNIAVRSILSFFENVKNLKFVDIFGGLGIFMDAAFSCCDIEKYLISDIDEKCIKFLNHKLAGGGYSLIVIKL